jgi:hypothetical protein
MAPVLVAPVLVARVLVARVLVARVLVARVLVARVLVARVLVARMLVARRVLMVRRVHGPVALRVPRHASTWDAQQRPVAPAPFELRPSICAESSPQRDPERMHGLHVLLALLAPVRSGLGARHRSCAIRSALSRDKAERCAGQSQPNRNCAAFLITSTNCACCSPYLRRCVQGSVRRTGPVRSEAHCRRTRRSVESGNLRRIETSARP